MEMLYVPQNLPNQNAHETGKMMRLLFLPNAKPQNDDQI